MGEKTAYYSKLGISPVYYDDRYELLSTIGRGKSSVVYLTSKISKDETLDIDSPPIALKVLLNTERDPENAIRRIKKESLALLSCVHPSIIRMHDYVAREDACYISMEYAKFGDIKNLLKEKKSFLSPLATLRLTQELLGGVNAIHSAGIIHRDIKPENILLAEDYQVKICDFSVCLLRGEKPNLNLLKHVVGTIDYLAPECLSGQGYSISSDLYAVAVTAFEMLTGILPFSGKSINESMDRKKSCHLEEISGQILHKYPLLVDFFKKALAVNPEDRFKDTSEMSKAIDQVIQGNFKISLKNKASKLDLFTSEINNVVSEGKSYLRKEKGRLDFKRHLEKFQHFANVIKNKFKVLSKFFSISFIVTIASIFSTNLLFAPNAESKPEKSEKITEYENVSDAYVYFSKNSGIGILSDLYTADKNYRFVLSPISENSALFVLLVKGWEPVEVNLKDLKDGKPIVVMGKGLNILLKVNKITPDLKVEGTYENLVTARMGNWSFEPTKN